MNFVGKPKPVICDIDLCKFHRTCYTSTASAVFWQEDAFQRKLEYDHTSSLNSAHLSPKELNSLPTSHPIRKNQVPLRLKSCSASEISPFFFWQWESIQCSIIQTPGMKEPLAIFGPRKFMFGASSQAPRADFLVHFQPVASLKTNRMQKKVTRNSLGLAQSSEGKSPLFQIKNPPSTLAKVRQLQWTNPNIHLYFQFICSKLFRYCSYYS